MALTDETFVPSGAAEIRDMFLADVRLEALAQGVTNPPVQTDTEWFVVGTGLGNIAMLLFANIRLREDNTDVFDAKGAALDRIRAAEGLVLVEASPASGAVVASIPGGGPLTIADGLELTLPNGVRGKVSGQHLGALDGDPISVVTIDTGEKANLAADETVQFVTPPTGLDTEALVSKGNPLTGGLDEENDARKRDRILNRRRNLPASGNWGANIEVALNALASLQYAFPYPALGGPASRKVVLVRDIDVDNRDFSREVDESAVAIVRDALLADLPEDTDTVVQSAADEGVDASINVVIPDSAASGGNGQGWIDETVWPDLVPADSGRIEIDVVVSTTQLTVSANTAVSPVAGQTHIDWWSTVDQRFYERLVTVVGGASGAWELTLDAPLVDTDGGSPIVGEFISPAAVFMEEYGNTLRDALRLLGPGENTIDPNRVPRANRHPFIADDWRAALTIVQLLALKENHTEITDVEWEFRSVTTPTIPGSVVTAPNVLVLNHFGIYRQ